MSYQVLARKWRPQNFKQMVGQEHVLKALIHALESQRLHHAYLFTGTRGVGKTTIGRILAKCLSCHTGITAEPCGTCGACQSITQGRYVDLIEIDAASRTKVEDMRELLDNVQYAASEGRFKIYLIDEVHMLSTSSFNALLKTLEEPPEHVKFLFATTDPQKLPVTILSRCLQFNLKNMPPERIVGHLQHILGEENVQAEDAALWALARAADGSMRDALSLTDQAIAYGNHSLTEVGVSAMLGTVDQKKIYRILDALVNQNAAGVLEEVKALSEFSPDYTSVLASLISILHRVAIEQAVPGVTDNTMGDKEEVTRYANQLCAEDVQLFYQIALVSRKDLAITPDPQAGLEMALLRMMAFQLSPAAQNDLPVLESQSPATSVSSSAETVIQEVESANLAEVHASPESASTEDALQNRFPNEAPPVESYEQEASNVMTQEAMAAEMSEETPIEEGYEQAVGDESKKKTVLNDSEGNDGLVVTENVPSDPMATEQQIVEPTPSESAIGRDAVAGSATPETKVESPSATFSTDPIDIWPKKAAQVEVTGMTQNLLLNMALEEDGDQLKLYSESGHFRLLNRSHEDRIIKAMKAAFGESKKIVLIDGLRDDQETPMMWRERKKAEMLIQAKQNIQTDPNVQKLIELFDARVIEGSIQALGEIG